jgi:hypothetical protein
MLIQTLLRSNTDARKIFSLRQNLGIQRTCELSFADFGGLGKQAKPTRRVSEKDSKKVRRNYPRQAQPSAVARQLCSGQVQPPVGRRLSPGT